MSKHKKLYHDEIIVSELTKIKVPIIDEFRGLSLDFKAQSRSNETGFEHIAKGYHDLKPKDVKIIPEVIKKPCFHSKDKRYPRTYCYYHKRKGDPNNYVKVVVKVDTDLKTGFISSVFIAKKLK